MHRRRRSGLRALAAATVAVGALVLPTTAATATAQPHDTPSRTAAPVSSLTLTIEPALLSGRQPVSVLLECTPDGGTHPNPEDACAKLAAVGGVFEDLTPGTATCLPHEDPVTITAIGNWGDRAVTFRDRYTNAGCAAAGTDGIFAF